MNVARIPKDELMSYTLGQFNTIIGRSDSSSSKREIPVGIKTTPSSMKKMQEEYLASLSKEELIALKKKHGIR